MFYIQDNLIVIYDIDIDGNGVVDFQFEDIFIGYNARQISILGQGSNSVVSSNYFPARLNSNTLISSAQNFISKGVISYYSTYGYSSSNYVSSGNWNAACSSTEKYVGVNFDVAGANHFGWIRLSTNLKARTLVILPRSILYFGLGL